MTFGPQRGHIACIFENFFKDFGLLILAIVIGLIQGNMDIIWENMGVLVIVLMGPIVRVVAYLTTTYAVDEEKLLIQSGLFNRNTLEVPISTITTVDFSQNIFHQIFGVYRLNIDNSSNISNNNTKVHMTLSKDDADFVKGLLIKGREGLDGMNFAAEHAEATKATESAEVTAIQPARDDVQEMKKVTDISQTGRRYDVKTKDLLLMGALQAKTLFLLEMVGVLAVILSFVPIPEDVLAEEAAEMVVVLGLGVFLLLIFLCLFLLSIPCGMIGNVIRYYGFKVLDNGQAIKIEYGLLNRKSYTIPKKKISGFYYEQSAMMRLAKAGTLNLMAVGYGESGDEESSEASVLFPLLKEAEVGRIIGEILPQMETEDVYQKPEKKALRYFFIRFSVFFSIAFLGLCLYLPKVSDFFNGVWILGVILLCLALVSAVLSYRCTAAYGNENHFSFVNGGFKKMTVYVKTNMIESIEAGGSIWKRKKGIADISIGCLAPMGLSSQGADNMPIAFFDTLKEKLIY